MDMQHDRITGSFDAQHGLGEQIAGDAGNDILGPQSAVSAVAVAAILELPSTIVGEYDMLFALVADDARLRVGKFTAARQFQLQKCTTAFEGNGAAPDDAAALAYRRPRGTINVVPKAFDLWMCCTLLTKDKARRSAMLKLCFILQLSFVLNPIITASPTD